MAEPVRFTDPDTNNAMWVDPDQVLEVTQNPNTTGSRLILEGGGCITKEDPAAVRAAIGWDD